MALGRLKTKFPSLVDRELLLYLRHSQNCTWHVAGAHMFAELSPRAQRRGESTQRQANRKAAVPNRSVRAQTKNTNSTSHNPRQRTLTINIAVAGLTLRWNGVGSSHQHLLRLNPFFFSLSLSFKFRLSLSVERIICHTLWGFRFGPGYLEKQKDGNWEAFMLQ